MLCKALMFFVPRAKGRYWAKILSNRLKAAKEMETVGIEPTTTHRHFEDAKRLNMLEKKEVVGKDEPTYHTPRP
jgi:hypothetical protein